MTKQKLLVAYKTAQPRTIMGICFLVLGFMMLFFGVMFIVQSANHASALLPAFDGQSGDKVVPQLYPEDTREGGRPGRELNLGFVAVVVSGVLIVLMGSVMVVHRVRLEEGHQKKVVRRKTVARRKVARAKR